MHDRRTTRTRRRRPLAFAVLAVLGAAGTPALEQDLSIPQPGERERLLIGARAERTEPRKATTAAAAGQSDFDVTRYFLDLDFDDTLQRVSGSVSVTARSLRAGLLHVPLDLHPNLTVSSVVRGAIPLAFTHAQSVLDVTLDRPFAADEEFEIRIAYSGSPLTTGPRAFGWNKKVNTGFGEMVWSLSEPEGARIWWPCKDRPDDKALVEEWWTVRPDWVATGNGVLQGVDTLADGRKRYRWRATHPLTTYLVSIAATNYVSFTDSYDTLDGGSMPIEHYVYPEDLGEAQVSFSRTPEMLGRFAELFGEYPFVADKYGMSAFPFNGAMEHSTNTSYGYGLINGGNNYDWVIAHEAAHQWWGDSVSPETWNDLWLNEGFASHCEALWIEHVGGPSAYHQYMNAMWRPSFNGPVYAPIQLFSTTTYDKGAWVQHMLRGVLGDAAFFQGLRAWYDERRDSVGNTAQYQATMEASHGAPLDWFFQPWVYGTGQPQYEYGWRTANLGGGTLRNWIRIRQVHAAPGPFTMPIRLTLVTASGSEVRTVWNDAADQYFALDTTQPLLELRFDEANWVLDTSASLVQLPDGDGDGVPDGADNCAGLSNAAQQDTDGDRTGDACDLDDDDDGLEDAVDCAALDAEQGIPDEVPALTLRDLGGAGVEIAWAAAPRADSYDVVRSTLEGLGDGWYDCVATGLADTRWVDDALPEPGSGFAYLVRALDLGCGGAGSLGADSNGTPRTSRCP